MSTEQTASQQPMTGQAKSNQALLALVWGGILLLLGGALPLIPAIHKAQSDARVASLTRAMLGYPSYEVQPSYTLVWVLVALAALGLLMLVAALIVKAARPGELKVTQAPSLPL